MGFAIGGFDPFSSPSWQRSNSCQIGSPGPLPRPPIDCEGSPPPGAFLTARVLGPMTCRHRPIFPSCLPSRNRFTVDRRSVAGVGTFSDATCLRRDASRGFGDSIRRRNWRSTSRRRSSQPQPQSPRREGRNTSHQNRFMPEKRSVGGYLSPSLSSCDAGFLADLVVGTSPCLGNEVWLLFVFRSTRSNFACMRPGGEAAAAAQAVDRRTAAIAAPIEREPMRFTCCVVLLHSAAKFELAIEISLMPAILT